MPVQLDFAVFADTQCEPAHVYEWLNMLKSMVSDKIPVIIATGGALLKDTQRHAKSFTTIPTFFIEEATGKKGMGQRQCTTVYKIFVVQKAMRIELNYEPRKWMRHKINLIMGISIDERERERESREKWITNVYPLIESETNRAQCKKYIEDLCMGTPPRSACYVCPYMQHREWQYIKDNCPKEWALAIEFDEYIRDLKPGYKNYLYRNYIPLKDATFKEKVKDSQLAFFVDENGEIVPNWSGVTFNDECDGVCGV